MRKNYSIKIAELQQARREVEEKVEHEFKAQIKELEQQIEIRIQGSNNMHKEFS